MHLQGLFSQTILFTLVSCQATISSKRGLVYVPSAEHPQDDRFWISPASPLSWYYNYGDQPSSSLVGSKIEFVPQLWGRPSSQDDTAFLNSVTSQIKAGANITFALGFNEPDMASNGGSSIDPSSAAQIWEKEIQPLAKLGVKLGSPACTSAPGGISWMQQFLSACNDCTINFMAVHFYGNFEGLASHVGQYVSTFNKTVWVTEYADPHVSLNDTQTFFNQSISFMDRNPNITRYSYFGAFRSDVSNVGANAAFLTRKGELTDIGSMYLGGGRTGKIPSTGTAASISPLVVTVIVFIVNCFNMI